jgi:exodeoxyribonuclease V beta subunit
VTSAEIHPFDICGPLPSGVTVLEASAGTGKTFTIAGLAARYVAGGIPLERVLLVTFSRMATSELRERVRDRLVTAEHGLALVLAGGGPPAGDDIVRLLAAGAAAEVEARRRRLARALADFDAATIATTHGFCQHVLAGLGVAGDTERDIGFVEDVNELVEEVVDDLYVRRFWPKGNPPFDRREALRIARVAVNNPTAPIEPAGAAPDTEWAMRRRLALAVRDEVEARKRRAAVLTYDDFLTRLADTLADPAKGAAAAEHLRSRFQVALVDEFQDTDPVQWDIMRRAFAGAGGGTTLVLIGDPKQAIYAFRGADVYAYLEAAREAGTRATLGVNWRSDQGLIDAYDALFRGARLGHEGIAYRTVRAAETNQEPRLAGAPVSAPLRLRVVHRADGHVRLTPYGYVTRPSGQEVIAGDLAADVARLLSSGAEVVRRPGGGAPEERARVRPAHIAVLVRTHRQAALVRDALERAGIQAVINGAGSVFATPVAREWLRLLEALERPASPTRARSAALTAFLGWSVPRAAAADERAWESVHARLHRWAGILRRRGVASLLETVTLTEGLPQRILGRADGERQLTDLRHIGQLLHAAATAAQLGPSALTTWLRQRIAEAAEDTDNEERSRRLESDAEAVQVLTIHRSKGLEFPIVYSPYLWEPGYLPPTAPPIFHDPAAGDRRTIDVGGQGSPDFDRHWDQYVSEQRGEDLRLAYVALTRAQHQAVVWWAGSWDSRHSPLGRLLFARADDGTVAPNGKAVPTDDEVVARFEALAAGAPGCVSVERAGGGGGAAWAPAPPELVALEAGRFERTLDTKWRRTSYTAISAGGHEPRVGSEPEEAVVADEPPADGLLPQPGGAGEPDEELRAVPSLLAAMPGGVDVGTFVHRVLERADFTAADLRPELARLIDEQRAGRHLEIGDCGLVAAGLAAAIETPLGALVGERRLRDFGAADRLDELAFELPLVGGEVPTAELSVSALASLLAVHLPAGDALAGYPERLADPGLARQLRGFLAGSLDLVLRFQVADGTDIPGTPRTPSLFMVVDYKTNRLARNDEGLSAWHYRPAALAEAMQRAHYPLQALLYSVALHRYLRWRLPGYRAEVNLAGVAYLFLRGMTGPDTPRVGGAPCGVFAWRPPAALIEALSDLLDVGVVAA